VGCALERLDRTEEALVKFQKAWSLDQTHHKTLLNLLRTLNVLGKNNDVITIVKDIDIDELTNTSDIYYEVGVAYFSLKEYPLSKKFLSNAIALDPDHGPAAALKRRARLLRAMPLL